MRENKRKTVLQSSYSIVPPSVNCKQTFSTLIFASILISTVAYENTSSNFSFRTGWHN